MRYEAVKDIYEVPFCEHPLCEKFHKNGCPTVTRTEWIIIDTTTGERGDLEYSGSYDLKRDAMKVINRADGGLKS